MGKLDWQKWGLTLVVLILAAGGAFYLRSLRRPVTELYVPRTDLPAYHRIAPADLMPASLSRAALPSKPALQEAELVGRYTNQPLIAEKPVPEAGLVPIVNEKYMMGTTAVSIPATAAMAYNGRLAPGTLVRIWSLANGDDAEVLLEEVLVLDVQKVEGQSEGEKNLYPYIIVLAVPEESQGDVLTASASRSLAITQIP